jgi:hypothetical protein
MFEVKKIYYSLIDVSFFLKFSKNFKTILWVFGVKGFLKYKFNKVSGITFHLLKNNINILILVFLNYEKKNYKFFYVCIFFNNF